MVRYAPVMNRFVASSVAIDQIARPHSGTLAVFSSREAGITLARPREARCGAAAGLAIRLQGATS